MFSLISKVWEFISRLSRIIVKIDDMQIEAAAFWDWLIGKEDE